ncbi:uncharacterized protein METZ01_LOCUS216985, partial [marine metagenome]
WASRKSPYLDEPATDTFRQRRSFTTTQL